MASKTEWEAHTDQGEGSMVTRPSMKPDAPLLPFQIQQ